MVRPPVRHHGGLTIKARRAGRSPILRAAGTGRTGTGGPHAEDLHPGPRGAGCFWRQRPRWRVVRRWPNAATGAGRRRLGRRRAGPGRGRVALHRRGRGAAAARGLPGRGVRPARRRGGARRHGRRAWLGLRRVGRHRVPAPGAALDAHRLPSGKRRCASHVRCRARCLFISNMVTLSLPKTLRSVSSARISRRSSGFCRLRALM